MEGATLNAFSAKKERAPRRASRPCARRAALRAWALADATLAAAPDRRLREKLPRWLPCPPPRSADVPYAHSMLLLPVRVSTDLPPLSRARLKRRVDFPLADVMEEVSSA